jgi:hypothetical protein
MKILSILFCDDVRQEASGKLILIGVYDIGMVIAAESTWPVKVPMAFYLRFQLEKNDPAFDAAEFKMFLDDELLIKGSGPVNVGDFSLPIVVCQRLPNITIKQAGTIRLECSFISEGKLVGELKPDCLLSVQSQESVPKSQDPKLPHKA